MQKKLIHVAIMMLLVAGIWSCKKDKSIVDDELVQPTSSILDKTELEQIKYAEANLKKIATSFAVLAKNTAFVNFVHTEAAKKFDEEYEVLIERMQKNPTWASLLNTKEINEGLAAFKNLKGENFYPQIYIPKMQHDEENNSANFVANSNSVADADIKICVYAGSQPLPNTTESFPGYEINNSDSLVAWGPINEDYSNEHEVWVFSLNEVVNNNGLLSAPTDEPCGPSNPNYPECTYGGGGGSGGGGTGSSPTSDPDYDEEENFRSSNPYVGDATHYLKNCKIDEMTVREHKENWIAGGSEVAIRAVLNTHNNRENGLAFPAADKQYKSDQASWQLGKLICKVSRKKVNNQTKFTANYTLQAQWPSRYERLDPVWFDFVIFERDVWPSPTQYDHQWMPKRYDSYWSPPTYSSIYKLKYRSAHEHHGNTHSYADPYARGSFCSVNTITSNQNQFYQSGLVNNYAIGFNTIDF
jgi:hypothetical protein